MIYELANHVQSFLSEHNKPPSRSFHEEMLKNHQRQKEKQAQEEQQRMDQRRKQEEEMVRRGDEREAGLDLSDRFLGFTKPRLNFGLLQEQS